MTEIPDFDFETEDLMGVSQPPVKVEEQKKERPELAKVVDHDDDALGKIGGEF